jgi:hypothetical protein
VLLLKLALLYFCDHGVRSSTEVFVSGGEVRPLGSVEAHISREVRSIAEVYVAAPELTLIGRRGLKLRNTWRRQSSTQ